jgi:hypothetical protein
VFSRTFSTAACDLVPWIDADWLQSFEDHLDPARLKVPNHELRVVNNGTTGPAFQVTGIDGVVFRRMPPFSTVEHRTFHRRIVDVYSSLLRDRTAVPAGMHRCVTLTNRFGEHILYILQERKADVLPAVAVLPECDDAAFEVVIRSILSNIRRVWYCNEVDGPDSLLGLDAVIHNWGIRVEDGHALDAVHLDTSLPLLCRGGRDQIDASFLFHHLPSPIGQPMKETFDHDVLPRYYDHRLILIDFLCSLAAAGMGERVSLALDVVNRFIEVDAEDLELTRLQKEEIDRMDSPVLTFWPRVQKWHRIDRFFRATIFRRRYSTTVPVKRHPQNA